MVSDLEIPHSAHLAASSLAELLQLEAKLTPAIRSSGREAPSLAIRSSASLRLALSAYRWTEDGIEQPAVCMAMRRLAEARGPLWRLTRRAAASPQPDAPSEGSAPNAA